jgi:hypothetical protein
MALHLLSASRLADDLAAARVTPREQATYLAVSGSLWLIPGYFSIAHWPMSQDQPFATAYWWTEFAMLVLVNGAGVFYCLQQCRIDPSRHFVIDFACLYAPVAIVTLTATWAAFHALLWALPHVLAHVADPYDARSSRYLYTRVHDLLLYVVIVGQLFAIYWGTGRYMRRAAERRA